MALILQRKPGQRIVLMLPDGQRVSIKVDEYARRPVKLYVEAPESVGIFREELLGPNAGSYAGTYEDWRDKS